MRTIKTITGIDVVLDGDLLAIMDILYREVTAKHALVRSFDDMNREIANLLAQMTAAELRSYLQEALFVNTITYENQKAAAYIRSVGGRPSRAPAPSLSAQGKARPQKKKAASVRRKPVRR